MGKSSYQPVPQTARTNRLTQIFVEVLLCCVLVSAGWWIGYRYVPEWHATAAETVIAVILLGLLGGPLLWIVYRALRFAAGF